MKIIVERFDGSQYNPDLVVLVGDPYQNFTGNLPGELGERVQALEAGFLSGRLTREVSFAMLCQESGRLVDYLYFHTSLEKGFTAVESLKTFLSRALRMASETGRDKVALLLGGPDGEGLIEQLVEGALVGTFKFSEFLKDGTDRFVDMELILCPPDPTPPAAVVAETSVAEQHEVEVVESASVVEATMDGTETVSETIEEASELEAEDSGVEESVWPAPPAEEQMEETSAEDLSGEHDAATEDTVPIESEHAEIAPEAEPEVEVVPEVESEPVAPVEHGLSDDEIAAWRAKDESSVYVGQTFGNAVNLARALISRPASVCTPAYLAKVGEDMAKQHGFAFQSFGPPELKKHDFVGHLAVGGGSSNAPRMFEMTYQPATESNVHLILLGKGVTFDTGGISIKSADKMHLMVGDMSGAAAVLGAMDILGRLKPNIKVSAVIVAAENSPDGKSYRPGDILKYKNGVSVHVENTDAEGRLLLADGLIRAGELGATHIVDISTLTGGCARALGPSFTGIMGANRKLINAITRAGGNHGESYWRLPLPVEYRSMLKTFRADINNMGGAEASATTAGLFLQEFVPARTVWAHLDIAGTFWKAKAWKYYQEGPSGTGVKTLADLALRWHEHLG